MSEQKQLDLSLLYVEDEATTREEVGQFLKRRVRTLVTAANGQEGLERFRACPPDLVVTDIRMPVLDGLAMVGAIRALDREAQVVVTTAHSDTSFLMQAIEVGVDHYVLKPVAMEQLLRAVLKCNEVIQFRRAAKLHQEERESLIKQLQDALSKVKQLSGFLPICASCKKIRNDKGYWEQIESYIREHSEAEFSHGICPECAQNLYGEYLK